MLENYEAAKEDRRAMCGDTGVPRWYVKFGNDARVEGGPRGARSGAAPRHRQRHAGRAAAAQPRASALAHRPQQQRRHRRARRSSTRFHPDGDWIDLTTVHKGGLFGSDYRMLFPGDGIEGIKRFYLDTLICVRQARPRLPAGDRRRRPRRLEGHLAWCSASRRRACARSATAIPTRRSPRSKLELKELGNSIGMGAMGFMGSSMVVDCHIEVGYCHTGGMPMSVHMFCLSSRRAIARIFADGRAEFRTDPQWFTPYMRRETVEWTPALATT